MAKVFIQPLNVEKTLAVDLSLGGKKKKKPLPLTEEEVKAALQKAKEAK